MIGSGRNTIAVGVAACLGTVPFIQISSDARLLPGAAIVVIVLEGLAWLVRRVSQLTWPGTLAQLLAGFAMIWIAAAVAVGGAGQTRPWQVFEQTWTLASEHIYSQTVPMAADDATLVLLLAGAGVLTIVIDLAFIGARSVLLAALPLLAGYLTSMIVLDEAVGIVSIVAVCVGWLVLLASRTIDHEQRWPRGLTSKDEGKFNARGFIALAVGLGSVSVATAVVAGLAIPPDGQSWLPQGTTGRHQSVDLIDPTISLNENLHQPDERPLLSYTTSSADGVRLRSTALTVMTAAGWQMNQMTLLPGSPDEPTLAGTQSEVTTQVTIGDYDSDYLPAPYAPLRWDPSGSWAFDPQTLTVLDVAGEDQPLAGQSYSVDSLIATPDATELATATAGDAEASSLPDDVPAEIVELAHQITDGAASDGEKALALQNWLNDPSRFSYDLQAPEGMGFQVLVNFLFNDRRGYCIHFASAMALMAQEVGIPARVAVGFTTGVEQADGSWLVTSHNMHAWPELNFSGLGWVSFEPTVSIGDQSQQSQTEPSSEPTQEPPAGEPASPEPQPTEQQSPTTSQPAQLGRPVDLRVPLGLMGVLLVLAIPALTRAALRRRRLGAADSADKVNGAWRELEATATDLGMTWPAVTPRQLGAMPWPGLDAEGRAALRRIALLIERQRYAAGPPAQAEVAGDVAVISTQWYSSVGKGRRFAARIAPRSLLPGRVR
ncbi:DUF3488 and transglutaminase-like domain-containing protein [Brooklawnia sp.]|uniref:transglutaminase family protein n=1 Tax=Brooklawnia sp. TaxID=2699740 RepID=UPI00311FD271